MYYPTYVDPCNSVLSIRPEKYSLRWLHNHRIPVNILRGWVNLASPLVFRCFVHPSALACSDSSVDSEVEGEY